ncbi:MAG TPA: DUF2169 domain-containing protein, partial [Burkholderiaceae bacterium]|nr:DUF2169 domain-containing protein [Burkholderiaceae bacterium]
MKIIKPDNLALLYRTLRFGRRDLLSLGLLGLFHFDRSNPDQMLPEAELWTMVAQALGDNAVLDEGLPKPAAEFMVYGAACAADGREVPQLPVAVRLGTLGKQLYVYGDREFQAAGMVSAPLPFARIEIRPENAFGGPGFADNPVGKGFAATDSQTGPARHLPNLESPRQLMLAAGDEPVPAGFWGITADAPRRRKHLGTFDDRWLKHSWPHLPEDTSLEFFHAAP